MVFYNGDKEQPDELILRLSDAFPEGADADVDVRVRMLNINHGRNPKLLDACQPLKEYNEAEAMKLFELDGERRGERRGIKKGENNMADLMQRLFAEGRVEDARRAASDQAFRNHLFKEYSIM